MKQVKEFIFKYPFIFSVVIMITSVAVTFIPIAGLLMQYMEELSAEFLAGVIEQTLVSVLLIMLIARLKFLRAAGFKGNAEKIWLLWPGILFLLLMSTEWLCGEVVIDYNYPVRIVLYVLLYLSTGLFEETLCRGLIFPVMLRSWGKTKKGRYGAVLLSSLVFGSFHFIHFFLGHASLLATLAQVTYATFIGVFMCAIVIRNHSIYPAIILHGLIDIVGDMHAIEVGGGINKSYITMDITGAVSCVMIVLPLFIYGMCIVRKEFRKEGDFDFEEWLTGG